MFDEGKANKAVKFIESLKHTKGKWAGKRFELMPWQRDKIIKPIFGTVDKAGFRTIRNVYIEMGRKNGKSEIAAAIGLELFFADGEAGAQVYMAAADREQASLVFDVAVQMVRQAPALAKRCKIVESTKRLIKNDGSIFKVLSSESYTKHGLDASAIIFDELHAQPNRELYDVLTTSFGSRRQPLLFMITTAGYDRNSICWEMHEYSEKILKGVIKDKTFLPVIYSVDESDNWEDEKTWAKANPGLGIFRSLEEMRSSFVKAKESPAFQNTFRRLYLSQWTKQDERYLDLSVWMDCQGVIDMEELAKYPCWAGLDLASTTDIAALVLVFYVEDRYICIPCFFVPGENVEKRGKKDRVPYPEWVQQGFIEATPGNVIDYRYIRKKIKEITETFNLKQIAFDRWGATEIMQYLEDDGIEVVQFGQGFASMSPPTKAIIKLVTEKRLVHNNNPVLNWMADNLVVKMDPAGNVKPDKSKSTEKIDGMVALIMALDIAMRNCTKRQGSVYEEKEIMVF